MRGVTKDEEALVAEHMKLAVRIADSFRTIGDQDDVRQEVLHCLDPGGQDLRSPEGQLGPYARMVIRNQLIRLYGRPGDVA